MGGDASGFVGGEERDEDETGPRLLLPLLHAALLGFVVAAPAAPAP